VSFVVAMREVDAGDVHARADHLTDDFFVM
jgi:hypothetical protein